MRPEPKEIVDLANAIVKAEEYLAGLRAKWDAYFPLDMPPQSATPVIASVPKKGGRSRQPGSLQGSIMELFEKNPGRSYSADDVATIVRADRKKVAGNLAKLAYKKKLRTHTRGLYVLEDPQSQVAA
jgi:hypothetical protein